MTAFTGMASDRNTAISNRKEQEQHHADDQGRRDDR